MATRNTLTFVRPMISGPWAFCESIMYRRAVEGVLLSKYSEHADPSKGANGPMVDLRDSGFLCLFWGVFSCLGGVWANFLWISRLLMSDYPAQRPLKCRKVARGRYPLGLLVVSHMSLGTCYWSPAFCFTKLLPLDEICV